MADFPNFDFLVDGYRFEVNPDNEQTEFYSLNTRLRAMRKNRDTPFSVSMHLTNAELSTFETFVSDTISNGADSFTVNYWEHDSESTGTGRIVDGNYNVQYLGPDNWKVSFTLEILDRDLTDHEAIYDLVNAASGFETLYDLMLATEDAVNNNNL